MFTRTMIVRRLVLVLTVVVYSNGSVSQQGPAAPNSTSVKEFPVNMKQNVTAGATPVGTKVEAKLLVATLVGGTVFPKNTIFSGEVLESVAKSATTPSRIGIRMDSAQWKNGSAPVKVYLTAWCYPLIAARGQDLSYGPQQPASKTWNGAGTYPDPSSPASQPFPSQDMNRSAESAPESPVYSVSKHRVLMKDIESERHDDGAVAITSNRFNIKLDKLTTYVLATGDLTPGSPGLGNGSTN
jgi:hypothetical protein